MLPSESIFSNLPDAPETNVHALLELGPETTITEAIRYYLDSHITNKHTRRSFRKHLGDAVEIMAVETVGQITVPHLVGFYFHVMRNPNVGKATKAQAVISVRSFLSWGSAMGAHSLQMERIKYLLKVPNSVVIRPHEALSKKEIEKILIASRHMGKREFALILVGLGAGPRIAELVNLDCQDIQDDAGGGTVIHIRQGKGGKDRLIPVLPEVRSGIEAYLESTGRKIGDLGPLFQCEDRAMSSRESWRLTTRTAGKIIREAAERAGIRKRVTPHALRHTFAFACYLHSEHDLVAVQHLLGHASVATTMRYVAHLNRLQLRSAIPAYLGGGRLQRKEKRRKAA